MEYTTAERVSRHIFRYSGSTQIVATPVEQMYKTFQAYIDSLSDDTQKILEHTTFPDNGSGIARAIRAGKALVVADGSYNEQLNSGAAAWKMVGAIDEVYCEGRIGQPRTSE